MDAKLGNEEDGEDLEDQVRMEKHADRLSTPMFLSLDKPKVMLIKPLQSDVGLMVVSRRDTAMANLKTSYHKDIPELDPPTR